MVRFRAGVAALLCMAWAVPVSAQYRPPGAPYIAPPPIAPVQARPIEPPPQPQIPWDDGVRQWQEEQADRDAAAAQFRNFSPQLARSPLDQLPSRDDLISNLEGYSAVLGAIVAVWVVLRVCAYFARPDRKKYIMSDPWVQARLAQQGVPPDQPPQAPPA